ncbi:RNA polymerase sigma factor [Sphingobacterium faecium]|uniref:RNA polymerase sigma factor n=1 Tax=Sphingobacterium faecium TaxID=34087 RepID=UPI00320A6E70
MMKSTVENSIHKDWVVRLRSGDVQAFEWLYNNYKYQLTANLFKLLKSSQMVEDMLQDIFIKIWENRLEIDPDRSFGGYLYRMATNMVTDSYRKSCRSRDYRDYLVAVSEISYQHIDQLLEAKERKELLNKALQNLSPQCRQVFELCKIEGRSYQEVANLLQISPNTISTHLTRANKKMQLFLTDPVNLPYFLLLIWVK